MEECIVASIINNNEQNKSSMNAEDQVFQQIIGKAFSAFETLLSYKKYRKREMIIQENEAVPYVYFIKSGLVKLSYIDLEAQEFILSFAFEDWWETDFAAFYNQTKATLMLQCLEDTEVYRLSYDNYVHILKENTLSNYFLDKSIKGHIANQRRILSLLTMSPKDRYEQFIALYPSLVERVPKSVLSRYLGVSRETLSRLYKSSRQKK
jgi:CRP-like cAMP-binding protein